MSMQIINKAGYTAWHQLQVVGSRAGQGRGGNVVGRGSEGCYIRDTENYGGKAYPPHCRSYCEFMNRLAVLQITSNVSQICLRISGRVDISFG